MLRRGSSFRRRSEASELTQVRATNNDLQHQLAQQEEDMAQLRLRVRELEQMLAVSATQQGAAESSSSVAASSSSATAPQSSNTGVFAIPALASDIASLNLVSRTQILSTQLGLPEGLPVVGVATSAMQSLGFTSDAHSRLCLNDKINLCLDQVLGRSDSVSIPSLASGSTAPRTATDGETREPDGMVYSFNELDHGPSDVSEPGGVVSGATGLGYSPSHGDHPSYRSGPVRNSAALARARRARAASSVGSVNARGMSSAADVLANASTAASTSTAANASASSRSSTEEVSVLDEDSSSAAVEVAAAAAGTAMMQRRQMMATAARARGVDFTALSPAEKAAFIRSDGFGDWETFNVWLTANYALSELIDFVFDEDALDIYEDFRAKSGGH